MADKQATKEYLDNFLSGSLQETLERKAQQYKKHGFEKQAKKVRAFKKQVREMVGSLWATKVQTIRAGNISNATSNPSTIPKSPKARIGGVNYAKLTEKKTIGIKVTMKATKSILHNDREIAINLDKVLYATPIIVEETGQELLKVVFEGGQEIDVIDKFNEFADKMSESSGN